MLTDSRALCSASYKTLSWHPLNEATIESGIISIAVLKFVAELLYNWR
mgnify:CR=1 FL=1